MITPLLIGIKDDGIFDHGDAFAIPPDARRKHMAIFGATGAGKSTLLRNMIATDIAAGAGVTVVDPHGGLVDDILENHIPRSRTNDVIHFDPKNQARTLALNILEPPRPEQRGLVVSNAVSIFHRLWAESWGPRMEDILRNSLYALVEQPRPVSLLALPKLLTDTDYRAAMLARVTNPSVIDFFRNTFDRWTPAFREEAISPVLNKCRAFLTDPMLRAVIGQARSSFDFRWIMDNRKILLCDFSKGSIGEDNAQLLGSLVVIKEKLAALSRHDVPEEDRVPHVLYTEEAQNFIGDFPSILQEARKYRLILVLATQGIEQLSEDAASAVFTNCATLASFRVSGTDAARLMKEFATPLPASSLQDLQDYKVFVRTLTTLDPGGPSSPSGPFCVKAFPPLPKERWAADRHRIVRTSRERFTRPRAAVDAELTRFLLGKPDARHAYGKAA
jgi:type IV secretory pathway TraG/TraD family ATPase VirD4